MKKIHLLPDIIIAKIAAGEVIERPGYAVKELIDNSIDAGADFIRIEIEQGGLKKIVVSDNGEGMTKEDLVDCFKLHTTSKVAKSEISLLDIKYLGFRGEALSSIAAISDLVIQSRVNDSNGGNEIELKSGYLENIRPIGIPKGTIVTVNNLFYTVPARKQFLKSIASESRFITEIISNFALAFPNIHFILINNKKTVLDLPKTEDVFERIKKILGGSLSNQLMPFHLEDSYIKASGYLSKPQAASVSQKQYIFVNGRRIQDKLITLAAKESYGNSIESNHYPPLILYLDVPPETIDVNVHPRKEQINFLNSKVVFELMQKQITQTLSDNNLTFSSSNFKGHIDPKSEMGRSIKDSTDYFKVLASQITNTSDIQQIHNLYLLTPTKTGLLIIDQHAAHERILYEQFKSEFKNKLLQKNTHQLTIPIILELSISDFELLKENIKQLNDLGFILEEFSDNSFKILQIPKVFIDHNIEKVILEILENLKSGIEKEIDLQTDALLKYLSCRTAIKRGDRLTKKQSIELITKLEQTPNNITCPHGRPTKTQLTLAEINKYFKR